MDGVEIVALTAETAGMLDKVAGAVFDNPVDAAAMRAFVADPGHHMFMARAGDTVVGMVSGTVLLHPDKGPHLFVNELGVDADWRRRGIGRRLMEVMLAHGRALGCVEAWVATETDNTPARALYRGMEPDGEEAAVYYTFERDGKSGCF